MRSILDPFQFVAIAIVGLMNQQQRQVIEYLWRTIEFSWSRRMQFNDDQRHRLAVKAKTQGLQFAGSGCNNRNPETLLGWHRKLIAEKYDGIRHNCVFARYGQ